jgi:DeoR-like protein with HTH domain
MLEHFISQYRTFPATTLLPRFKVSQMTVRRDLEALEAEGLARPVRGGAVTAAEPFEAREPRAGRPKALIARKLALHAWGAWRFIGDELLICASQGVHRADDCAAGAYPMTASDQRRVNPPMSETSATVLWAKPMSQAGNN